MQSAPISTPEKTESINIENDNKKFLLIIKSSNESITFIASEPEDIGSLKYLRKMSLKEIKEKETHNLLIGLNTCGEFSDYLKALSEMKKLLLIKKEDKINMIFTVEYLLKKHDIEIDLFPEKINIDEIIKELCKEVNGLKEEVKNLKKGVNINLEKENKELKNSIEQLKNENINLKNEIKEIKKILEPINKKFQEDKIIINSKSVIMRENEFNLINLAVKSRLNKDIKELKKLYQATIDGDGVINFHSKCDNIPNTLVLFKSAGNRRFGGFTTQTWESTSGNWKDDKNAFLFSLDKQRIYSYKNNGYAIYCYKDYGPTFGGGHTIYLGNNPIQQKQLYTYESYSGSSYNFNGDNNALSESGNGNCIYAAEYEVFQVIFN